MKDYNARNYYENLREREGSRELEEEKEKEAAYLEATHCEECGATPATRFLMGAEVCEECYSEGPDDDPMRPATPQEK